MRTEQGGEELDHAERKRKIKKLDISITVLTANNKL